MTGVTTLLHGLSILTVPDENIHITGHVIIGSQEGKALLAGINNYYCLL